jgi:chaperonin GroES
MAINLLYPKTLEQFMSDNGIQTTKLPRPVGDYVLIEIGEVESKTPGGIVMPETARRRDNATNLGIVVAVGTGRTTVQGIDVPCTVKTGDRVMFPPGGITIRLNTKLHALSKSADLFLIFED